MKSERMLRSATILTVVFLIAAYTCVYQVANAAEDEYTTLPMPPEFIAALEADGTPKYVTADGIETEFRQFNPELKRFYYNKKITKFIVPEAGWLKDLLRTYDMLLSDVGLVAEPDTWDCENYSGLLNALTTLRIWRAGYLDTRAALGWLRVNAKKGWAGMPGTLHSLIFTVTVKGIYIIEPQNGQYISLSEYPNRKYVEEVYLF
jgi:hypothetical protein